MTDPSRSPVGGPDYRTAGRERALIKRRIKPLRYWPAMQVPARFAHRSRYAAALLAPLLLVAASGCDVVTADLKHSETAEWRKTYDLAPAGRVEINNVNGRIVVQPSNNRSVEVVAIKTARGATLE